METELLYEQQDYLNGWTIEHETYQCLYCDVTFQFEKIYPDLTTPSALQTAKGAAPVRGPLFFACAPLYAVCRCFLRFAPPRTPSWLSL